MFWLASNIDLYTSSPVPETTYKKSNSTCVALLTRHNRMSPLKSVLKLLEVFQRFEM